MEKLKDLYKKRQAFIEYNSPVPAKLDEQIREEENKILKGVVETIVGYLPEEINPVEECSIVVAVEYVDGKLVKTASAFDVHLGDLFENVDEIKENNDEEEDDEEDVDANGYSRAKSVGFTVKFADGKIIRYGTAVRTMLEALRYMGLERSSSFMGETFKGYPLIGKKQRQGRWQKNLDGWWVYVNMRNDRKISCLKGVSKMLNIPLEIISDEDNPSLSMPTTKNKDDAKPKGRRELFSLNGSTPMTKNRSVWETVRRYLEEMPDATFADIAYQFPARLQGSYGVVRTIEDINERKNKNLTEGNRWFLETAEILTAGDGVRFAVSSEWGNNFPYFQDHILKELGWTLEEV